MSFTQFDNSPASTTREIASTSPEQGLNSAPPAASIPAQTQAKTQTTKPRKRVNTAEKRTQHNAIERARRETLNSKFLGLAGLLPALASNRRPSKAAVVNGSISHLTYQRGQRLLAAKLLRRVCADHDKLLAEVNQWRKTGGMLPCSNSTAWTEEVDEVCSVEKEVFGTFASFGEDDEGDDGNDASEGMGFDQISSLPDPFAGQGGNTATQASTDLNVNNGQAMFTSQAAPTSQPASIPSKAGGFDWAQDFAPFLNNAATNVSAQAPFGSFVNDCFDHSAGSSPADSALFHLLTPATVDCNLQSLTPSPRSCNDSGLHMYDDQIKLPNNQGPHFTQEQLSFLNEQGGHHGFRQQQASFAPPKVSSQQVFNRTMDNVSLFPMNTQTQPTATQDVGQFNPMAIQQLYANLFNPQSVPHQTSTMGQMQPSALDTSLEGMKNAVRSEMGSGSGMNMSMGMGMSNFWGDVQGQAVEGF